MGGGSKGSSTSSSEATIAPELRPLYSQTGQRAMDFQNAAPLTPFTQASPMRIAPLSETQNLSLGNLKNSLRSANTPLEESDIAQAGRRYFQSSIAPDVENRAALSGLGRSTALTNALSSAEAQTQLPLLQEEQARRDRLVSLGLAGGETERGAEQDVYTAEQQDMLRRQALAEQGLFGVLGQIPSTTGQTVTQKTKGSGGGLFK